MTKLSGEAGCCWAATARETSYPRLEGKERIDVAVIGGGIVGLTAALALSQAGRSVAVLEARRIGHQVTGRSTAKITTQHGLIYRELLESIGREKAALYADANRAGLDWIVATVRDQGLDCDLERKSAYAYVNVDRSHVEDLEREAEAALDLGLPADVVDRAPLPFPTGGALRFTDQAQFNPARYLIALANLVSASGGQIFEETRVTEADSDGRWQLVTAQGAVEADQVIVATNLPAVGPEDFSARTQPHSHAALAFRIDPAAAPDGMFISVDAPMHSVRTGRDDEGSLLVVLGPRFITGHEKDVAKHFAELERWARARFDVGKVAWRWMNEDYDTADRVPYAGALAQTDGLYLATGFNAWGITNGTAAGLLLSDCVAGRSNRWAPLYDPARSSPNDFHKSGATQSEVSGLAAIANGAGGVITCGEEKLAVWKDDDGTPHAISAACTHKGCTVTWNNAERTWDCPCHGSIFATDGAVIHGPAVEPLPSRDLP